MWSKNLNEAVSDSVFEYTYDIYNIIISRRKIKLAKKVRNDIFERALKNNEFKIYYQ